MAYDEKRFEQTVLRALRIPERKYRTDLRLGQIEEWDSVAHLSLIVSIEETFGVRFRTDEIADLTGLDDIRERLIALAST